MKIIISSDHAGFELKKYLIKELSGARLNMTKAPSVTLEVIDIGPKEYKTNDAYPLYAQALAKEILKDNQALGVMICGTGQGSAMSLNRFKGVRAALCITQKMALLSREHNNANVLCLGARLVGKKKALAIVRRFLRSQFQGGRHLIRLEEMDQF